MHMLRIFHRRTRGQVLPLTALLLGLIGLSAIFLYNSNIIVTEKVRHQNTADAAAYSTATMDARYMNFMAYSNRAMIADQVITAQFIGIASHGKMLKQTGSNLETFLGWIPYYGYYIKALAKALKFYSMGLDKVADVNVPIANTLTKLISLSQASYRFAIPLASSSMTQKVVQANDKDSELSTIVALGHSTQLAGFLERYDPAKADSKVETRKRADEFYDVTMGSRNKFTAERSKDWQWFKFSIPFVVQFYPVKYGGTDMRSSTQGPKGAKKYKTFAAMDTLSLQLRTFTCHTKLGWPKWCKYVEIPLGYGAGIAGESYQFYKDTSQSLYGNGAWKNSLGATLQTYYGETYKNKNYDGLQAFHDIKKRGRVDNAPTAYVALTKDEGTVATNTTLGTAIGSTNISEKGSLRKGKQFNIAKASAYFQRPSDIESTYLKPGKREFGNIYNPFWQPRLEKSSAMESQGLLTLITGV